jgi:hypothetical protein
MRLLLLSFSSEREIILSIAGYVTANKSVR